MKSKLSRFGLGLFGLAAVTSTLAVLFFNPLAILHPLKQFGSSQSAAQCPPRPTREFPTEGPPITIPRPTPAPTPTDGPPQPVVAPVFPTLEHPLTSKKQALRQLLKFDTNFATWDEPWCVETLRLEPGRIKVKQYASEYAYSGVKQPPAYGERGPIWVVTIKGQVSYSIPCMSCTGPTHAYGLRYTLYKNTGLVGQIGGLPQEK